MAPSGRCHCGEFWAKTEGTQHVEMKMNVKTMENSVLFMKNPRFIFSLASSVSP